ncbi:MAG: peptidase and domain protein [Akkermansiaceae bacterium]|nr:peptidase and domain protein [Akkermansiaceae bacterium]
MLSKDEIKAWLAANGRDRAWLAERCGVSKSTVNNWLSTSISIPLKKLQMIDRLTVQLQSEKIDERRAAGLLPEDANRFMLQFSEEDFARINDAANKRGMRIKDYIAWAIRTSAVEDQKGKAADGE